VYHGRMGPSYNAGTMTTPERFERVEELFHRALELEEGKRAAFLERECPDPEMRAEVGSLLTSDARETVTPLDAAPGSPVAEPAIGSVIGPYRLTRSIGQGGMGVVFEAEQGAPVRRTVALKLMRLGLASTEFIARFEGERQALALMEHPGIAQVHDAGTTEQGHPYFVMELVRGSPITRHADDHRMDVRERVELFLKVCAAVQHAHEKGVIHRDLKPSNILITNVDGMSSPKIIDFGIAKAIGTRLTDETLHTMAGQFVGTPEYMSPEQARHDPGGMDTRSDVYSLGVLLYELLVGTTPHPSEALRESGVDGMRRIICDVDPATPSTRLTRESDTAGEVADKRRTEPLALRRRLRGDLDWIVMKALEKERFRRYPSASEMAADLERYLRHEPVLAGPPGAAYRIGKFVRRHRLGVAAASLILLVVIVGAAVSSVGFFRARSSEQRALEETASLREVTDFLVELFEVSDPSAARGNEITAREVLDRGVEKIDTELADQPLVRARLLISMGRVYRGLGLYEDALPLLEDGAALLEETLGDEDPRVAAGLFQLGRLYFVRARYADAAERYGRALAIAEGSLDRGDRDIGWYTTHLGTAVQRQGSFEDARPLLEEGLRILEAALGPDHLDTAIALYSLAWNRKMSGRLQEARGMYEQLVPIFERELGDDSPDLAWCLNDYAVLLDELGDKEEALPLYEKALAVRKRALGANHSFVAHSLDALGSFHLMRADFDDARPYYDEALAIRERNFGPDHSFVGSSLNNIGLLLSRQGKRDEARQYLERALSIAEKTVGPVHKQVANTVHNLAVNERLAGNYQKALPLQERAVLLYEETVGPHAQRVGDAYMSLGFIHWNLEDREAAAEAMEHAFSIYQETLGPEHGSTGSVMANLAALRCQMGDADGAWPLFREGLAIREKTLGADHFALARHLIEFGRGLQHNGRHDEAIPLLERALAIDRESELSTPVHVDESLYFLAISLAATGKLERAEASFEESLRLREEIHGPDDPLVADCLEEYAKLLHSADRPSEAAALEARASRIRAKNPTT
jgi:eukaryotic-like serine/threonine-protein kinase